MAESQPKTSSGMAIAGLVLGILAILGSFLPIINNISFFLALIGGVFAIIAFVGAMRGKHTAKGMSIAGIVLAVVSIVVVLATQSMYSAALDSASKSITEGDKPVSASSASSEDETDADAKEDEKAEEKTEPKKDEAKEEDKAEETDYSNMSLGQSVDLESGLTIVVNSVEPGPTRYDDTPTTCANVTITNNGDSSESFNPYDWKSLDANGVESEHTYVTDATDELNSGKLQPGGTVTGNVYFEGSPVKILYYSNMFNSEATVSWNV